MRSNKGGVGLGRLGRLRRWSNASKCAVVAVIVGSMSGSVTAAAGLAGGWPYFPDGTPGDILADITMRSAVLLVGWVMVFAVAFGLRHRIPHSRALVHVTVQYYAVVTAWFQYLVGPFHAVAGFSFLGGVILGLLLFDRAAVLWGLVGWAASLATIAYFSSTGALPYEELLRLHGNEAPGLPWAVRMALPAVLLAGFIIFLTSAIIADVDLNEERLENMARHDSLTGLVNRRYLRSLAAHELRQARRYHRSLGVLMIDLDHFKSVNDEHGHATGDRVLVAAARAIEACLRDADVLARYGGEEFVVLVPSADAEGAREVAERCRQALHEVDVDGVGITASFGVASFPASDAETVDDLLNAADAAMYGSKSDGRDRVTVAA